MGMLHILMDDPVDCDLIRRCIDSLAPDDALVLIEATARIAAEAGLIAAASTRHSRTPAIYVLDAPRMTGDQDGWTVADPAITSIDYDRFVELTVDFSTVVTWA